jgi:hypothetical protein
MFSFVGMMDREKREISVVVTVGNLRCILVVYTYIVCMGVKWWSV